MDLKSRLVALSLAITTGILGAIEIPTDGTKAVEVCVPKNLMFSIQTPCPVLDVYFTRNIKANISRTSPNVITGFLFGAEGTLTLSCGKKSYTLIVKAGDEKKCDAFIKLIDFSLQAKDLTVSDFDKEKLINYANALMVAMVKGENLRGYERRPYMGLSVVDNDDYLRIKWKEVYVGGLLIGFVGEVENLSSYFTKNFNVKRIMQKGWVEVYVEGWEHLDNSEPVIELLPLEKKEIFVVMLRNYAKDKYPFAE
jgi:hypothetical protein